MIIMTGLVTEVEESVDAKGRTWVNVFVAAGRKTYRTNGQDGGYVVGERVALVIDIYEGDGFVNWRRQGRATKAIIEGDLAGVKSG